MVVGGTSIIDVGGVAGCRNACEDKCGQELKHACKRLHFFALRLNGEVFSIQYQVEVLFCKLLLIFEF